MFVAVVSQVDVAAVITCEICGWSCNANELSCIGQQLRQHMVDAHDWARCDETWRTHEGIKTCTKPAVHEGTHSAAWSNGGTFHWGRDDIHRRGTP